MAIGRDGADRARSAAGSAGRRRAPSGAVVLGSGQRTLIGLQQAIGNQAVGRLLSLDRPTPALTPRRAASPGAPAVTTIQRMSEAEHQALREKYAEEEIELAAHLVLAARSPIVSSIPIPLVAPDDVEAKIAQRRASREAAWEDAFRAQGMNLAAGVFRIVHETRSDTNCHAWTLTGDYLAEGSGPPDTQRLSAFPGGPIRPVYALYYRGNEIAHSAVLRSGDREFTHKFKDLPVIECNYLTMAGACGYDRVELLVDRASGG